MEFTVLNSQASFWRSLAEISLFLWHRSSKLKHLSSLPSESMLLSICIPTFLWLNAFQAVRQFSQFIRPSSTLSYTSNRTLTVLKILLNSNWERKNWTAMTALSKFLVLLAIFLSASLGDAFVNHARLNHLIRFDASMSNPTNEPSCFPYREPTNDWINDQTTIQRLEWNAELSNVLSSKQEQAG